MPLYLVMSSMPAPQIKFGTDGWRGIIGDDFTYESLRYAAQGVAEYLGRNGPDQLAVVGYDCRFASEVFAEEVARVLAGNDIRSLLFDRPSPTQVASWTVIDQKAAGAAVITASHNPYLCNGLKYKPETGSSAPPEVIAELERRINAIAGAGGAVQRAARDHPLIGRYDPRPAYYRQIGKMIDLAPIRLGGLRVLHEVMYGSGYGYVEELLGGGSTTVIELHAKRNPFFGGFNPEPIPDNLPEALQTMKSGGYDLCICTDGDADRVGIIDGTGRFVNQLQVYALLMVYLIEMRGWKGPVVRSVNMTHMADALGERYGVPVYEVPVGFKNVAPKMMETDAVLGGEESGGFAIRGHIPERDGILAGLCFADMMVRGGRSVSQLLEDLEAKVGPQKQPRTVAGVEVERVRDDDGFKFFLRDGSWVLLRTSGTEPLIRVYAEARDAAGVEKRLAELEAVVGLEGK